MRHICTGKEVNVQEQEAVIVYALMASPQPLASFHYALAIATHLSETGIDHIAVVRTIERLWQEGFLEISG